MNNDKIDFSGYTTRQLFAALDAELNEVLDVDNSTIPVEVADLRGDSTKLAKLVSEVEALSGETEHKKLKAEKARRIELYRQQMESGDTFEYVEIDENAQYGNMGTFAGAMILAGVLDADDFIEEWHALYWVWAVYFWRA